MDILKYIKEVASKPMSEYNREALAFMLASLSSNERDKIQNAIDSEKLREIYKCRTSFLSEDFIKYYDPKEYKSSINKTEPFEVLLRWTVERTEGKLSAAKRILKHYFYGYSTEQQVKIIKALLLQARSDRRFAYQKIFAQWNEELADDILACWNEFHDEECATLITRLFPTEIIKDNLIELSIPSNYYTLCKRVGAEPWFKIDVNKFPDGISIFRYLEAVALAKASIETNEAEELLYRMISVAAFSSITDVEDPNKVPYEVRLKESRLDMSSTKNYFYLFPDLIYVARTREILSYLSIMGLHDVVNNFLLWRSTVEDHYLRMKKVYKEEDKYYGKEILSLIYYLFPTKYKYMLEFEEHSRYTWLNTRWDVLKNRKERPVPLKETYKIEDYIIKFSESDFYTNEEFYELKQPLDGNSIYQSHLSMRDYENIKMRAFEKKTAERHKTSDGYKPF